MPRDSLDFAIGRLPYASEIFGTYRPLIGWTSSRKRDRAIQGFRSLMPDTLRDLLRWYISGNVYGGPPDDRHIEELGIGRLALVRPASAFLGGDQSFLLPEVQRVVAERAGDRGMPDSAEEWQEILDDSAIAEAYGNSDRGAVKAWSEWRDSMWNTPEKEGETGPGRAERLFRETYGVLDQDSRLGAALLDLAKIGGGGILSALLGSRAPTAQVEQQLVKLDQMLADPFVQLDPRTGLAGVNVSPLGIVHYFRQYFFELDTFLGPAVGHVWLTPGASVELVESSSRRTYVEQTTEYANDTKLQRETLDRRQEDLSDTVRQENRSDTKLGFSTTVNQSWPTGDATATASINLDSTQAEAREVTYKRMREQSEKVSTEMRSSYKSTFKTVTETTDVSSKRYVLSNPSETYLQNYEMRRKMRRVAVQTQDVGTYLCWETFIDEPGTQLGLANLVHIAKQPDVTPPPYPADLPIPERKSGVPFQVKVAWAGEDDRVGQVGHPANRPEGISLGIRKIAIDIPSGYAIELLPGAVFGLECLAARGEGHFGSYAYIAKYLGGVDIDVILQWGQGGLKWDEHVDIDLKGTVSLVASADTVAQINSANKTAREKVDAAAASAQRRADEQAFYTAAQERIELAAGITTRRFEDLREEERTVVYRRLIEDLMAGTSSDANYWYRHATAKQRHAYATVLNAIFDIDRMLYFVAPEWWKPRARSGLHLGGGAYSLGPDKVVAWEDTANRTDNYLITGKSEPARLGSSLGWLLQLDGDDMRNRFLNASWVRAVIPVRPGKEEAAIAWLRRAEVEGSDGLDSEYIGEDGEADEIRTGLAAHSITANEPPSIGDAIRLLCIRVAEKHNEGTTERLFPDRTGLDDGDKVWATPIDKVYEHGFYPLERSFRSSPVEAPTDGSSPNFQVMSQWTEVLPTDQVVPVAVAYDPNTGRQISAEP